MPFRPTFATAAKQSFPPLLATAVASNACRVVSKTQILDRVWDYDFGGRSNIVELYISYLRKKIDSGREPMIHTLRGSGYVLKPANR